MMEGIELNQIWNGPDFLIKKELEENVNVNNDTRGIAQYNENNEHGGDENKQTNETEWEIGEIDNDIQDGMVKLESMEGDASFPEVGGENVGELKKDVKKKVFSCKLCDQSFTKAGSLRMHRKRNHKSGETFPCDVCHKVG